jgi:hypothetical protein
MGTLDLNQPIFAASAGAANDWGSISGGTSVEFRGNIQARRGLDIDLGLLGMANLDASFSQFLAADLSGQAIAQASVRGQVQIPLNLFSEIGMAIRLQAIAELAAGIRVGLGLSVGDFLSLADQDPHLRGMPARLLRIFLEEVDLEASFFAKAALSAMAYANFVVVGSALADPVTGITPGFTISTGAGAGLKAGGGYQIFANVGIKNFSKLVGRSVDVLVDEAMGGIINALPPGTSPQVATTLLACRTPAKLSLRLAYELGEYLALNNPDHVGQGQDGVSHRVLQVTLEELQRATLEGIMQAVSDGFGRILTAASRGAVNEWNASRPQRLALSAHLRTAPEALFTLEAVPFWLTAVDLATTLATKLTGTAQPEFLRHCAALWCATQLLNVATQRVIRTQAQVLLLNSPVRQVVKAFSGPLSNQPPAGIGGIIRQQLQTLGINVSGALEYEHLVAYLADQACIDILQQGNVPVVRFLSQLLGPFAPDLAALVRLILENGGTFVASSGAPLDPAQALGALTKGITDFVATELTEALRQQIGPAFERQPDLRLTFDEVLLPSIRFAMEVVFDEIISWGTSDLPARTLTEALSAILLRVLGRSLVATGDILLNKAQAGMAGLLRSAAAEAERPGGLVQKLAGMPGVGLAAADIAELVMDGLEIAADVFGPMPSEQRQRWRGLFYEALDPLAGLPPSQALQALEDPAGMPNFEVMQAIATELGNYAVDRFVVFSQLFLLKLVEHMINDWEQAMAAAIALVEGWVADIQKGLQLIGQRLIELVEEIEAALAEIQRQWNAALAAFSDTIDSFSDDVPRARFIGRVADKAAAMALGVLEDNDIYRNLVPGNIKATVRNTVKAILREAISASPLDDMLHFIGDLADEMEDLVDDARAMSLGPGFAAGVRDLVLSRLVAIVDDRSGTLKIKVKFPVDLGALGTYTINLGNIKVPLTAMTGSVRLMVSDFGMFDDSIDAFAGALKKIFQAEQLRQDLESEKNDITQEKENLTGLVAVTTSASPRVIIERPVAMQSSGGSLDMRLRLEGFTEAILSASREVPQRLHVLLNGQPLDIHSFRATPIDPRSSGLRPGRNLAGAAAAMGSRPRTGLGLPSPGLGPGLASQIKPHLVGAGIQRRARLTLPGGSSEAEPYLLLSGTLPANLLGPALNSLLVEVIVDKNHCYRASTGFFATPQAQPGLAGGVAGPGRPTPEQLPQAIHPNAAMWGMMLRSRREAQAKTLKASLSAVKRSNPLQPLANTSKKVAHRLELRYRGLTGPKHTLRLTTKKK